MAITGNITTKLTDGARAYEPWSSNQTKLSIVVPTTIKSMFLYNINTEEEIKLMLIPDSLSEQYSSRIIKESGIYGRVKPINFYTGGNSKKLSFSFNLHEDLNSIDGSLYKLLKTLKSMSKPIISGSRDMIQEPIVYFQMGDQFAGLGHINTQYTLNKPYRKNTLISNGGRYAFASVSITFIFHEEFLTSKNSISSTGESVFTSTEINLEDAYSNFIQGNGSALVTSIDDFVQEIEGGDYYITQTFANEKLLGGFLNAIMKDDRYTESGYTESYDAILDSINTGQKLLPTDMSNYYGTSPAPDYSTIITPIQADIFNFYIDLSNILSAGLVIINKGTAISSLYRRVYDYYKWLRLKIDNAIYNYENLNLDSVKDSSTLNISYSTYVSIAMAYEKTLVALESLENLLEIIDTQKAIYSSMASAGK